MTGPRGGVIGVKREQAIEALRTHMPVRFETSDEDPWLMGVLVRCSAAAPRGLDRADPHALGLSRLRRVTYTPPARILERYADVLVNFALGGGAGIKSGDVVRVAAHEVAKPLYASCCGRSGEQGVT